MPDFGLSAALEAALEEAAVKLTSCAPARLRLATRAGLRSAAPEAGAQGIKTPLPDIQAPGVPDVSIPKVNMPAPEQPPATRRDASGGCGYQPRSRTACRSGLSMHNTSDAAPSQRRSGASSGGSTAPRCT